MRVWFAIAVLIGSSAARASGADAVPVVLSTPAHVGDADHVSVKVKRTWSQKWTGAVRPPTDGGFEATLDGTETVGAVSPNGRVTRLTVKVTTCTKDGAALLPPGATVVAQTVDGTTAFKVNGAAPASDVGQVLGHLIYTSHPDEPTTDQEFGTDQPRRAGESWPANADQMAKATRLPFPVVAADFQGKGKLVAVAVERGQPVQTVALTQRCAFDRRRGEDGQIYTDLAMTRDLTLTRRPAPHVGDGKSTFAITFTATGPAGARQVRAEESVDVTRTDAR